MCPYSLTVPGGVQQQTLGLARELRELGHDTIVMGPCDGPPPEPGVISLGLSIPFSANGSVAPIAPDISAVLRTVRVLRDERFDVVHVHEPFVPGPTMTATLSSPVPVVGTFHRCSSRALYRDLRAVGRAFSRRLALRVAVSEQARRTAAPSVEGPFEVAFNGVDVDRFACLDGAQTDGNPTIVFVGRHEPRKGLDVLLNAMRSLPPEVRLWVIGHGPRTNRLKAATSGDYRIKWLGRVDDAELIRRVAGADVLCAPSLGGESFGVVLVEAMAAGTAVVASDLDGYREVACGVAELVRPGDTSALALALERVLTETEQRVTLATAGRRRAKMYAMARLARWYEAQYRHLANL